MLTDPGPDEINSNPQLLYTVCILSMPFNIEEKSGVSPVSVARVLYRRVMHFNIVAKSGVSPVSVARVL